MEYNSIENHLNTIFQNIIINGLTDENHEQLINVFTYILDNTQNYEIFNKVLLFNLINLIKQQNNCSIILSFLIKELELKSLRIQCLMVEGQFENENTNKKQEYCNNTKKKLEFHYEHPTQITDTNLYPAEGELGIVRTIRETDTERYEYSYEIDHTGKVLRFIDECVVPIIEKGKNYKEIDLFNKSIIENLKNKYLKTTDSLTENDLQ